VKNIKKGIDISRKAWYTIIKENARPPDRAKEKIMNKKFKVEYNPTNEYGSEWFTVEETVEAETEEEAIDYAKEAMIESARAFGYEYDEAVETHNNYSWRAEEV
jgi:hypothetical protein